MSVWFWRVLLLASLLLGQVAGFAHALSHLSPDAGSRVPDKGLTHHSPACDVCAAYDALGHAPLASVFTLPVLPVAIFSLLPLPAALHSFLFLSYYSRAPPFWN